MAACHQCRTTMRIWTSTTVASILRTCPKSIVPVCSSVTRKREKDNLPIEQKLAAEHVDSERRSAMRRSQSVSSKRVVDEANFLTLNRQQLHSRWVCMPGLRKQSPVAEEQSNLEATTATASQGADARWACTFPQMSRLQSDACSTVRPS
jgi:hypothetical protein